MFVCISETVKVQKRSVFWTRLLSFFGQKLQVKICESSHLLKSSLKQLFQWSSCLSLIAKGEYLQNSWQSSDGLAHDS